MYHFSMDIGKPETSPLRFVGKLLVVYAHEVHKRSLKVMHVYRVLDNIIAQVVSLSVRNAGFYARAYHERCKTLGVMVPSIVCLRQFTL